MNKFIPLLALSVWMSAAANAQDLFIAGTSPDQRPANAPKIETFQKTAQWYQTALHGITLPFPQSLQFLEQQGAWYTPFNHPGMTGPYDIRHWHDAR